MSTYDEIAPRSIEGLYVIGSIALDDWQPHSSDIDIVAITTEPADEEMAATLLTAHAVFLERCPSARVDGPFLAWGDLTLSPQGATRPWTLDGDFHHDAECFELNPVTWHTLATHGIRVRGPEAAELDIPLDLDEFGRFITDNSRHYWKPVHDQFEAALSEMRPTDTLPSSVPVWCLLGVCRMLYSAATGGVTSKSAAGLWAADVLGEQHRKVCESVVALRSEADQPVDFAMLRESLDAMAEALRQIKMLNR